MKKTEINSKSANCAEMEGNCAEMGANCEEMILSAHLTPISAQLALFEFISVFFITSVLEVRF